MKPAYNPLTRRQFLVGTGGVTLALPLLPSLLPREARAAELAEANKRYFVYVGSSHAPYESQFYGPLLSLTPAQRATVAGFEVRRAPLTASARAGGGTQISQLIQSRVAIPQRILGLMNIIDGLDMTDPIGHFNNAYCGAIGGNGTHGSIDQVLAASPKLFPPGPGGESQKVIVRRKTSQKLGGAGFVDETAQSTALLFDKLFRNGAPQGQEPIVSAVNASYQAVRSDPQISAGCKAVLDNFMDLMADTEARVTEVVGSNGLARPGSDAQNPDTAPIEGAPGVSSEQGYRTNPERQVLVTKLWNKVVVAGMAAGQTRMFVWGPPDNDNTTYGLKFEGEWHNGLAHVMKPNDALAQEFSAAYALQFEAGVVDMAIQMDAFTTSDGRKLLDKGLIYWAWEMGCSGDPNHHGRSVPVVTVGNSGGYFTTGNFLDYRNLNSLPFENRTEKPRTGLVLNQLLGMILRSHGLQPADFNPAGFWPTRQIVDNDHPAAVWAVAGQDLPFLRGTGAAPSV